MQKVCETAHTLQQRIAMTENLTERYADYAVYLPSLQKQYATEATRENAEVRNGDLPAGFDVTDLNFFNPKSKLWHCGFTLYSAGQFDSSQIGTRDFIAERSSTWETIVVGDSGGFQLGTGVNKNKAEGEHLERYENDADAQFENWSNCGFRERTLRWLEQYTDYAMTLDMVLWCTKDFAENNADVVPPDVKKSKIRNLSIQQLVDLSVDNLHYFEENTGTIPGTSTKYLNVLQDIGVVDGVDTGMLWYNAVKDFKFTRGWALGSDTGNIAVNTLKWLRRLLEDDNLSNTELIHGLMKSPPRYSVVYTAMQKAISKAAGRNIRITYDSSSPHQMAGKQRTPVKPPLLTNDIKTWKMGGERIKQSWDIARGVEQLEWEMHTPLAKFFTPNDLLYKTDAYTQSRTDTLAEMLLVNHNIYTYHCAALDACDLVWHPTNQNHSRLPTEIESMLECIEQYFETDRTDYLEKKFGKYFDCL